MFILTPSGSLNHEATNKFLEHLPANIKERVKLAVCLDALVNSKAPLNDLFVMQGSLSEADPLTTQFTKELKKAAHKKQVKVEIKDTNYSAPKSKEFIQFEHFTYNEHGIPAITVTAKADKY